MKQCKRIAAAVLAFICMALMITSVCMGQQKPSISCRNAAVYGTPAVSPIPKQAGVVHVNSDSPAEIMRLPNVGEKTAQAIMAERRLHGDYVYPEDLLCVSGVGEKTLAGFRDLLDLTEGE